MCSERLVLSFGRCLLTQTGFYERVLYLDAQERSYPPVSVTHRIPMKYNLKTCNSWTLFSNELHWLLQHDEYHMLHLVCASRTPPSSPKPPRHHANKPQENSAGPTVSQLHTHHAFLLVSSAARFLSSPSSLLWFTPASGFQKCCTSLLRRTVFELC